MLSAAILVDAISDIIYLTRMKDGINFNQSDMLTT